MFVVTVLSTGLMNAETDKQLDLKSTLKYIN